MSGDDGTAVIIPTHNRSSVLDRKLTWACGQPTVTEIIVVADRCTDGTRELVENHPDERVTVVELSGAHGPSAARNLGAAVAGAAWLLFTDDDDHHPNDYLERLQSAAGQHGAHVVGAPFLGTLDGERPEARADRLRQMAKKPTLDDVGAFPAGGWAETPWLCGHALVRRCVLERVSFDPGYRGNHWREETDFYVRAARAGFRVVLTGDTYSWCPERIGGGISKSPLWYEYWALRNHLRFLVRHRHWLVSSGEVTSATVSWLGFAAARLRYRFQGTFVRRVRRRPLGEVG